MCPGFYWRYMPDNILLKEREINDIYIGEGTVLRDPKDMETQFHAFENLGYGELTKRYGVKHVNIWKRPFEKIDLGDDVELNFNTDILNSDFVVDLPVLKTHSMTMVSLGIKNLKGMIDIPSRKKCHNTHPEKDLHFWVSRLADKMPPIFTLLDGIYTAERGPGIDGRMHRSNLLVASADILSADMVGAKILGFDPAAVPHLVHAANKRQRPLDLSDIQIAGEPINSAAKSHRYDFEYNEDKTLPLPMDQMGIQGLSYYKYDLSLCTYCSGMTSTILAAIAKAWKGKPWNDVEILSGKVMKPAAGKKKTILFGKCMYQAHKYNPDIQEVIAGPTHDIGKLCIPPAILAKQTPLSRAEHEYLKHHALAGYVLLTYYFRDPDILAARVARDHHERRDGSGYPAGRFVDDVLIDIVMIADIYDALI